MVELRQTSMILHNFRKMFLTYFVRVAGRLSVGIGEKKQNYSFQMRLSYERAKSQDVMNQTCSEILLLYSDSQASSGFETRLKIESKSIVKLWPCLQNQVGIVPLDKASAPVFLDPGI